jgi:hypothetical protein
MALVKVYPNNRVNPESAYLQNYRRDVMSQCGEDGLIEKIFEIMGASNKWCVEFGAWDGKHYSNSWSLINNFGWKAVLVEGNKDRFQELKQNYIDNTNVIAFNKLVDISGGENSLDSILRQTPIPHDFDFLCIDIDGCDWQIWESFTTYSPRLVSIEFNPTIPNHVHFVQDSDMSLNHGSSLLAMIELGKEKGYELVATTKWNAFFVRNVDFGRFNIKDNSIDAMHAPGALESVFFQLYDGTVVLAGCNQLLWHNVQINIEDIQVLPKALRKYHG